MVADTYRDKQGRTCAHLHRTGHGYYTWRGLVIYVRCAGDWVAVRAAVDWSTVVAAWTLRSMRLALGALAEKEERE